MDAALAGMDSMFYIAPAFMPNEADIGVSVVAAALMSDVLGRHIEAGHAGAPSSDSGGNGADDASPMDKMFAWYDKRGLLGNALVLRAILGREPRTLKAYLGELAASVSASTTRASR